MEMDVSAQINEMSLRINELPCAWRWDVPRKDKQVPTVPHESLGSCNEGTNGGYVKVGALDQCQVLG